MVYSSVTNDRSAPNLDSDAFDTPSVVVVDIEILPDGYFERTFSIALEVRKGAASPYWLP